MSICSFLMAVVAAELMLWAPLPISQISQVAVITTNKTGLPLSSALSEAKKQSLLKLKGKPVCIYSPNGALSHFNFYHIAKNPYKSLGSCAMTDSSKKSR